MTFIFYLSKNSKLKLSLNKKSIIGVNKNNKIIKTKQF